MDRHALRAIVNGAVHGDSALVSADQLMAASRRDQWMAVLRSGRGRRQRAQVRAVVEPDDMAGDGLSNRQIGDRLFLSPHMVSSYLYRSYPKLAVAVRHQLRDVIARASTPTTAHESTGSETLL